MIDHPGSGFGGTFARGKVQQVKEKVRREAKSILVTRKGRASEHLEKIAQALKKTGQQLREQDLASVAWHAERAAENIERVSRLIRHKDVDELIAKTEDMTRRRPVLLLAGAFALGFLLARMAMASQTPPRQPAVEGI
ncbi:MAG: hypothetical protein ACE14T_11280 [Syntrophales bacterium]